LQHFRESPSNFLLGSDPFTGEALWKTQDEHDEINPYKGLPDKAYIRALMNIYQNERIILVEKSRQMIVSTLTCAYIAWECLFIPGRLWLISKTKESDAIALIRDKIRGPWRRLPDWLKESCPASLGPQNEVTFSQSGSRILGVTENVARSSGRGMTASGFFLDEAAFQDQCRDIWGAVMPMAKKLIAVTTPSLLPGGIFLAKKFEEAESGLLLPEYMDEVNNVRLLRRNSERPEGGVESGGGQ
jgi:hypothetical protein